MKTTIILLAAGTGKRFGKPKRDVVLAGKTLLQWNLDLVKKLPFKHKLIIVTKGGKTRHESVKIGLRKAKGDIVIIHNVANPMASVQDFIRVRDELMNHDSACFVGQKIQDTVRRVEGGRSATISRDHLWRVQTPQGFRRKSLIFRMCHSERPLTLTDEIMVYENLQEPLKYTFSRALGDAQRRPSVGGPSSVRPEQSEGRVAASSRKGIFQWFQTTPIIAIETSPLNQKITVPEDLAMMERYLSTDIRVGIGEDSHIFDKRGTLVLGGMKIPGFPKLKANSDGDVLLHALCNALRSAMGQGSFSAIADPMCRREIRDSKQYIQKIIQQASRKGCRINNVAVSITCRKLKIDPLVPRIKNSLSRLLDLNPKNIGITATTGEGLEQVKNAIYCQASCTIKNTKISARSKEALKSICCVIPSESPSRGIP